MPDKAEARSEGAVQLAQVPSPARTHSDEALKAQYAGGARSFAGARLPGAQLSEADLRGACFDGADLTGAELSRADLRGASFRGATLTSARLEGAHLTGASLIDADLAYATLAGAKGLASAALAGADLRGCAVPEGLSKFEGLGNANEAARTTATLFFGLLAACTYSVLTMAGTTDAQLVLNSVSSNLPILGAPVQLGPFYFVAPLLLLALFLYFQLNLQRLWEHLAELPAVFPDGTPIHRRTTPWIFNLLPALYSRHLKDSRPPLFWAQIGLLVLLGWGSVPLTVLLLWQRYLHKHAYNPTLALLGLLALALGSTVLFSQLCAATLRVRGTPREIRAHLLRDRSLYLGGAIALLIVGLGVRSTAEAVQGGRPEGVTSSYRLEHGARPETRGFFSAVWSTLFSPPVAMLVQADLSSRAGATKEDLSDVKGAELSFANLRYARAFRAYLVRGNLAGADLTGAELAYANARAAHFEDALLADTDLREADLTAAVLEGAHLDRADLTHAQLGAARLRGADLTGANLSGAYLRSANLVGANLSGAVLQRAELTTAKLDGADLRGADLSGASGLTTAQLQAARVDSKTVLPPELLGERPDAAPAR